MHIPDAVRRALRTFFQAFVGTLLSTWAVSAISPGTIPDLNLVKRLFITAAVAGMVALLTYTQNQLEDAGAIPAVLKAPASVGADPVPDARPKIEPH